MIPDPVAGSTADPTWGQRRPRETEERDKRSAKNREDPAKKSLDRYRRKVSGCRTARMAILWGQSGANKRSPVL